MTKHAYAYYPGCSGQGTSMEYERSTRAVCEALGIQLDEIPDWSCCGSTPAHAFDHTLSAALSGRNLGLAAKQGHDCVLTPCPSCLTNLKTAGKHISGDENFRDKVNRLLDEPLGTIPETKSVLQVLFEDLGPDWISEKVKRPLTGLKVVTYYGCILTRPPGLMEFDSEENPISMDMLMRAAGAEVLPYPLKTECCGASHGVARKDLVMRLSGRLLDMADSLGAQAVVTACPLCQMNLDLRQSQVNSANSAHYKLPIFYYTQLLGWAFGLPDASLGLDKLCVDPGPALRSIAANEDVA